VEQLSDKLGIKVDGKYLDIEGGFHGRYGHPEVSREDFMDRIEEIEEDFEIVGEMEDFGDAKIGIVGGGGGTRHSIIQETLEEGCDIFITGNSNFVTDIYAYEKGLTMITLEETSSEKWGVYALGNHLKQQFPEVKLTKFNEKNW
jgi:putative NIF3 family GTP cyclohydrolase 1 type 2